MIELINFVDLSLEEKKMVLSWRNHPSVKEWMYNTQSISLESHLEYIDKLYGRKDKMYFLIKRESEYIGVVDFYNIDRKNKVTEFGLYSNINSKILGIGRILEKVAIDYVFTELELNKLKLEVFSTNIQVVNLHKKFKFKETNRKYVNSKEVICMELERD